MMTLLEITDDGREALTEELDDPEIDPRIRRKLMTIRMHDLEVPHATIATALNISYATVTNHVKLYRDEGLAGLMENRHYRPTSSVAPFIDVIERSFSDAPVATAAEGAQRIELISGIRLSDSQARRIMVSIRTTGSVNADTVCELVRKLDEIYPEEEITLVMDNTSYQRNKKVFAAAEQCGIELLFLPAYLPNLNLIERVCAAVQGKVFAQQILRRFLEFQDRNRRVH